MFLAEAIGERTGPHRGRGKSAPKKKSQGWITSCTKLNSCIIKLHERAFEERRILRARAHCGTRRRCAREQRAFFVSSARARAGGKKPQNRLIFNFILIQTAVSLKYKSPSVNHELVS